MNAKTNNSFEFDILKFKSSDKPGTRGGILYADVEEFETGSYRNPERWRRVSIRKTFVTFAQNKCSEAKIFNDLQPEQSQDKLLILDSGWQSIRKEDGRI